jgi:hypothetical protein
MFTFPLGEALGVQIRCFIIDCHFQTLVALGFSASVS